jgi:hypothetical protein
MQQSYCLQDSQQQQNSYPGTIHTIATLKPTLLSHTATAFNQNPSASNPQDLCYS